MSDKQEFQEKMLELMREELPDDIGTPDIEAAIADFMNIVEKSGYQILKCETKIM